jgi:hypothetical protein
MHMRRVHRRALRTSLVHACVSALGFGPRGRLRSWMNGMVAARYYGRDCRLLGGPPHSGSSVPIQLRIYAGQFRKLAPLASHLARKVTAS